VPRTVLFPSSHPFSPPFTGSLKIKVNPALGDKKICTPRSRSRSYTRSVRENPGSCAVCPGRNSRASTRWPSASVQVPASSPAASGLPGYEYPGVVQETADGFAIACTASGQQQEHTQERTCHVYGIIVRKLMARSPPVRNKVHSNTRATRGQKNLLSFGRGLRTPLLPVMEDQHHTDYSDDDNHKDHHIQEDTARRG